MRVVMEVDVIVVLQGDVARIAKARTSARAKVGV